MCISSNCKCLNPNHPPLYSWINSIIPTPRYTTFCLGDPLPDPLTHRYFIMAGFIKATDDLFAGIGDVASIFSNAAKVANSHMQLQVDIANSLNAQKLEYVKANADAIAAKWAAEKYGLTS